MPIVNGQKPEVRFEGYSPGTEIWGSTQADFLLVVPGRHAKEMAVLLNDPAAKFLAESTGREDGPEFRETAARGTGEAALSELVASGRPFESILMISRAYLDEHPAVLERVKAELAE